MTSAFSHLYACVSRRIYWLISEGFSPCTLTYSLIIGFSSQFFFFYVWMRSQEIHHPLSFHSLLISFCFCFYEFSNSSFLFTPIFPWKFTLLCIRTFIFCFYFFDSVSFPHLRLRTRSLSLSLSISLSSTRVSYLSLRIFPLDELAFILLCLCGGYVWMCVALCRCVVVWL